MALLKVTAFSTPPAKSGVSISVGQSQKNTYFRLGLTVAAQIDLFGHPLDTEKEALKLQIQNDPQWRHLMGIEVVEASDPEAIALFKSARDSVYFKLHPWVSNASKRPSASMPVENRSVAPNKISVKLPEFARPVAVHKMKHG